jgi:hypothetical protein
MSPRSRRSHSFSHTLFILIITSAMSLSVSGAADHWILSSLSSLAFARMDPMISPGTVSGHVHNIMGASTFSSKCSGVEGRLSQLIKNVRGPKYTGRAAGFFVLIGDLRGGPVQLLVTVSRNSFSFYLAPSWTTPYTLCHITNRPSSSLKLSLRW